MLIPLVDLTAQHRQIAPELQQRFARLFENTVFIFGEEVASFERAFAQFSGVKHCVGVGNGTDALEMMLRAGGVGNGDEVIVPTNSFIATAAAAVRAGAIPRFADSDPQTHLMTRRRWRGRSTATPRQLCRCTSTAKSRSWRN
jgi:dTDP-4-amino-4,6-dideoxygalactose transaminase